MPLSWVGRLLAKLRRKGSIGVVAETPLDLPPLGSKGPYHRYYTWDFAIEATTKEIVGVTKTLKGPQPEEYTANLPNEAICNLSREELFTLTKRGPYHRFASFPSGTLTVEVDREKYSKAIDEIRNWGVENIDEVGRREALRGFSCYETVGFTKPEHMEAVSIPDGDGSMGALVDKSAASSGCFTVDKSYYDSLLQEHDTYEWPASSGLQFKSVIGGWGHIYRNADKLTDKEVAVNQQLINQYGKPLFGGHNGGYIHSLP